MLALLVACTGEPEIVLPEGLESLDPDNRATWPEDMSETLDVVGGVTEDELIWAHARGYVHADMAQVFAALQEPLVVMDREAIDEYEYIGEEEGYDVSFVYHCVSYNIADVDWDMAYRESVITGSLDAPELVAVRAERIEGSVFFPEVLTWSLHVQQVEPGITSFEFVEHMVSLQVSSEPIEKFADALFVDVVAHSHGEELPDTE